MHWAAASLVAGCEPLSPSRRALGWTAAFLSLLTWVCATGVALHGGAAFIRAHDPRLGEHLAEYAELSHFERVGDNVSVGRVGEQSDEIVLED